MQFLTFFIFVFLLVSSSPLSSGSTASFQGKSLTFIQSKLECQSVTQIYPVTIISKLFSSVPKREYAIQNIDLNFSGTDMYNRSSFNLLVGRSASGKTTILRAVSGTEPPASGKVILNGIDLYPSSIEYKNKDQLLPIPKPIMIDSKPDCFDKKTTVMERIIAAAPAQSELLNEQKDIIKLVACEYSRMVNLSSGEIKGLPSELSPSGQYLFGIAIACMESSFSTLVGRSFKDYTSYNNMMVGKAEIQVPCPVLLLDELLDSETSAVASTVGKGLHNLARQGGIVLAATHRPEFLKGLADQIITMNGGKLLTIKKC